MEITNELGPMLDAEAGYIDGIKSALAEFGDSLTEKAEHDLRMGFRTKELVDLRIRRHVGERLKTTMTLAVPAGYRLMNESEQKANLHNLLP